MPAHRALECLDILQETFERLSPMSCTAERDIWVNRKTLANSARVCRLFSDLALDVLWQVLDELLPVFKLLPSYKVIRTCAADGRQGQNVIHFSDLSEDDWERFVHFTKRIRKLSSTSFHTLEARTSVLERLARRSGGRTLFPHLENLQWAQHSLLDRSLLSLISPSLQRISFCKANPSCSPADYIDDYDALISEDIAARRKSIHILKVLGDLLREVLARAPHVQAVSTLALSEPLSLIHLETVSTFRMATIDSIHIGSTLMKMLAKIPTLTELSIGAFADFSCVTDCIGFHRLEKLTIAGRRGSLMQLISFIHSPLMHTLSATTDLNNVNPSEPLLAMIASKWPSLRRLRLDYIDVTTSPLGMLRPLMSIRGLRFIHLGCIFRVTFLTEDVVEMATAWPDVEEFSLSGGGISNVHVDAVQVLIAFACHCPRLAKLRLPPLDFDWMQDFPPLPPKHGLQFLEMTERSKGRIIDHVQAAHLLDALFPDLSFDHAAYCSPEADSCSRQYGYCSDEGWQKVAELLKALRQDRMHALPNIN